MEVPPRIRNAVRNLQLAKTSRQKVDYLNWLFSLPTIWVPQARACPSFVEHMADLAQPESIKDFTPGSYDLLLWEGAVMYLSYLVHETEYTVPPHAHAQKLDTNMMFQFIQIINSVMRMRHRLPFLDPKRYELRYHISRVLYHVETEGSRNRNTRILSQLADSSLHGLNLLMWAAEPRGKPGTVAMLTSANYFGLYRQTEWLREGRHVVPATKTPIFASEPPETAVSVCRALLRKGQDDDTETYTTMYITSKLVVAYPWDFLGAKVHEDVVETLWVRVKVSSGGMPAWKVASAGVLFFHALMEAYNVNIGTQVANLWPESLAQMMTRHQLFPLIRRIMYILLAKENYTDTDTRHHQIMLNNFALLLAAICKLSSVFPRSFADECIKPTWFKDTVAFRNLVFDLPEKGMEKRVVGVWEELGPELGYNEKEMRRREEKKQRSGNLVGCSWHRCVLHNQVPHTKRIMLQDKNRCGRGQYCSETCQRRDWIDGKHSQICMPPKNAPMNLVVTGTKAGDFVWAAPGVNLKFV